MSASEADRIQALRGTLGAVVARAERMLAGVGGRPWSPEYLLTNWEEVREQAARALEDDADQAPVPRAP